MNILFAGWRNDISWNITHIKRAFSKFKGLYPTLDLDDFHSWQDKSGKLVLASLHTPKKYTGPRIYFAVANSMAAAFTGLPMTLEPDGAGSAVLDAYDVAVSCKKLEQYGEGRFSCFWIDNIGLHIMTDPFGLQPVFQSQNERVAVWSTSMMLLQEILCQNSIQPLNKAVVEYIAKGYVGSNLALLDNYSRIPGGKHLCIDRQGKIDTRTYYSFPEACTYRRGQTVDYNTIINDIVRLSQGLSEAELPCRVGITGGHDSRLIVGLLRKANVKMSLFSEGMPGNPDYDIGRRLANKLNLSWVGQDQVIENEKDWKSVFAYITRAADGHCNTIYAPMTTLNYRTPTDILPVIVLGTGGETARSYYLTEKDHLKIMLGRWNVNDFIERHLGKADMLLTEEGRFLAREETRRCLKIFSDCGIHDHGILSVYYVADRIAGWASGIIRCGENFDDAFFPLMLRSFQEISVNLKSMHQLQERLHCRLTQMANPELLKIPFLNPYPPQGIPMYLFKAGIKRLFPGISKIIKSDYNLPTSINPFDALEKNRKEWFDPLMHDPNLTKLWTVIDYDSLERVIFQDSLYDLRKRLLKSLYALLTVWACLHLRNSHVKYKNL